MHGVLVVAGGLLSMAGQLLICGLQVPYLWHVGSLLEACELLLAARMWDLVPWPGIEPRPPALGAQSLIHCATREVPFAAFLNKPFLDHPNCIWSYSFLQQIYLLVPAFILHLNNYRGSYYLVASAMHLSCTTYLSLHSFHENVILLFNYKFFLKSRTIFYITLCSPKNLQWSYIL